MAISPSNVSSNGAFGTVPTMRDPANRGAHRMAVWLYSAALVVAVTATRLVLAADPPAFRDLTAAASSFQPD